LPHFAATQRASLNNTIWNLNADHIQGLDG
jgi:hypothetical protein